MCQGPEVTTPCAAASHNARRRGQQSHKLVNRKLQAGVADVKCVDGAKISINLKIAMATKAGPSATKAKERARAFQPSEQMSRLSLQQMSEAILARPFQQKIAADVEAILPHVSSAVLESTISVADVGAMLPNASSTVIESNISVADVEAILPNVSSTVLESTVSVADGDEILPNVTSTVLESTISVEKLLLQFLKASDGASSQSATPADECQPESDLLGDCSAYYSNPMSIGHSPSLTTTVSHVVEEKDTTKHSRRRVQFDDDSCIVYEITPYAAIYGLHPREFVFGKDYCILPAAKFADIGTALRRSMGVMDEEDSESDEDEFDASEWEEEYFIL